MPAATRTEQALTRAFPVQTPPAPGTYAEACANVLRALKRWRRARYECECRHYVSASYARQLLVMALGQARALKATAHARAA